MEVEEPEAIEEIPLKDALSQLLQDDAYHNVTLKSCDGMVLTASRCALASRSQVFRKLLYGKFKESKEDHVPIACEGEILKAILEYIHTDECKILHADNLNTDDNSSKYGSKYYNKQFERIRLIVELSAEAHFFGLPGLCQKAVVAIDWAMLKDPLLAIAALDHSIGKAATSKVKARAVNIMRWGTINRIKRMAAISGMCFNAMEAILQHDENPRDQHHLFHLVMKWVKRGDEQTKAAASKLVEKHFSLKEMDPNFLSKVVMPSGLVKAESLMDAFRLQAMAARDGHEMFKRSTKTDEVISIIIHKVKDGEKVYFKMKRSGRLRRVFLTFALREGRSLDDFEFLFHGQLIHPLETCLTLHLEDSGEIMARPIAE